MTSIGDPQVEASRRSAGRAVGDYLRRDPARPPEEMWSSRPGSFGTADLSTERYLSSDWHRNEMARMWTKVWQVACHQQEIPEVGDYITYEVGSLSFLVVRCAVADDGGSGIRAYFNACLHRGTTLKMGSGNSRELRCPFHGWTWTLDGRLDRIPARWDFAHVEDAEFGLHQVRVDTWGGFVFVSMDPGGPTLQEWLAPLPEHFARLPLERRQLAAHLRRVLPCNWKVAQEAFIESYHLSTTHPQNSMNTNDLDTQYDVLSANVSRMITLVGVPGPMNGYELDDQEILDSLAEGSGMAMPDGQPFQLGDADSARAVLTHVSRAMWSQMSGLDTADLTAYDLIDGVEYSVFPNFVPWAGLGIPLCYTFTPYQDDPDRSVWDIWVLWPLGDAASIRPAPPLRKVADDEKFADIPELSWVGFLFDQDMTNLGRIQDGLKSLQKGVTMSAYQESRIRHHHDRLEGYLVGRP